MSTFMFGGSGLTLDIGARVGEASHSRGDVVQINPLVGSEDAGFSTQNVDDLDSGPSQTALYGVVLGTDARDSFTRGEDILVRIVGMVQANVGNTAVAGQTLVLTAGANNLTDAGGTAFSASVSGNRPVGVAHEAGTGLLTVWFNIFSWG